MWHRAKDRADAGQASKRSPIGDPPHLGTSAATARSAKAEIAESEYCSRFPYKSPGLSGRRFKIKMSETTNPRVIASN